MQHFDEHLQGDHLMMYGATVKFHYWQTTEKNEMSFRAKSKYRARDVLKIFPKIGLAFHSRHTRPWIFPDTGDIGCKKHSFSPAIHTEALCQVKSSEGE